MVFMECWLQFCEMGKARNRDTRDTILKEWINKIHLADCMDIMKDMPDNYIDLAIVDPPYGIDKKISTKSKVNNGNKFAHLYNKKRWDKERPKPEYWIELLRVSKNQIVCGGNYFAENLPVSRGWIFWDKMGDGVTTVNNELIYTSFDISIKTFQRCHGMDKGFMNKEGKNIHPTQKPIKLYEWILFNYAKPGQLILDTHSGSGSLACACHLEKYDFIAIEKDPDYHRDSVNRLNELRSQGVLF